MSQEKYLAVIIVDKSEKVEGDGKLFPYGGMFEEGEYIFECSDYSTDKFKINVVTMEKIKDAGVLKLYPEYDLSAIMESKYTAEDEAITLVFGEDVLNDDCGVAALIEKGLFFRRRICN